MRRLGGGRSGNRCVSETRVECAFLQILAQSAKTKVEILGFALEAHTPPNEAHGWELRVQNNRAVQPNKNVVGNSLGALGSFVDDAEELFRDFRDRLVKDKPRRP